MSILAGGLIGACGLAQAGATNLVLIAFGIGTFFWAVLAAVILARLVAIGSVYRRTETRLGAVAVEQIARPMRSIRRDTAIALNLAGCS